MDKPTYNDLKALIRTLGHQLVEILRTAKRIQQSLEASVTSRDLLLSRISLPAGHTLQDDGKVTDPQGNIVADYSAEKYECDVLLSAFVGLRALAALLENDNNFLNRPGVRGVQHITFIERFLDWDKRGGL